MIIGMLELDEIKKALEIYACKKYGIVGTLEIKVCIDYKPYDDIEKQITVVAKVETDN